MSLARWSVAVGAVALALGCSHSAAAVNAAEPGPPAASFYPLEVGRAWTYETQLLGERREVTVVVLREEGGYFIDSQGGHLKVDAAGVRDRQRYLLQNPVREGATWTNVVGPDS